MPRRLLLDGDDLGDLMLRVRSEMGPDAVVVKAERVRSGGMGGFFAKERFELTVEVPDESPAERPASDAPAGLGALLDAAEAGDGPEGPGGTDGVPASGVPVPRVSTDAQTFAALLSSIDGTLGAVPAPRRSADGAPGDAGASTPPNGGATTPPGTPAARFVERGAGVTAAGFGPLTPDPADAPGVGTPDAPAPASGAPAEPEQAQATASPTPRPAGPGGVQPAAFARLPAGSVTTPVGGAARATPPADASPADASPAAAPPDAPPAATPPVATTSPADDPTARALARLGVPASLLHPPADGPVTLARVVAAIPRPPLLLTAPGSLVAVIGEGPDTVAAARGLAQRAGLDPDDVRLAGATAPDRPGAEVLTSATAPRQRARTSTLAAVTVVAVVVGPRPGDRAAAVDLLAALDPDQCWAVVDARLKAADLRVWMSDVAGGRRFAAVAATRVEETREPGTVLDLGVPVGWLDGLRATPAAWSGTLGDRLDPDAAHP